MERAIRTTLLAAMQVLALCWPARAQQCGRELPSGQFADPSLLEDRCSDDLYLRAERREMPRSIQAGLPGLMELLHPDNLLKGNGEIERGCAAAVAWPDSHPATRNSRASGTPELRPTAPTAGASGTPDGANLYLVPFETIVKTSQNPREVSRTLALALVRVSRDGSCFDLIAKTAAPLERATVEPPTIDGGLRLDHFDFAPYRLNEQETAFGLRSYFYTMYIGGSGHDEVLELFRVKDGTIEPVLWTWMGSSNLVKGEQRGDPKGAVIRVLSTKTKGVFDLKKSVRGGRSGAPDAPGVGAVGWKSAIYRWNGQRYETHDPEPVECFNEPCQNVRVGK